MFWQYLKKNLKTAIAALLCCGIFALVFYLYNLPVLAVGYAVLVCLFPLVIAIVPDFLKYRKRILLLERLKTRVHLTLEDMPGPESSLEETYQELLETLFQSKCDLDNHAAQKYTEMLDYYTLWAHQIKTPIAAMRLLLQTEENVQNEELSEQLFKIEQYVNMVLQYLRIGSMTSDFLIRQYRVDYLVRQTVRKYARSFIRKKIQLDFKEIDNIVVTDEKWLVFVIDQVISNALKYTKKGKISIYMAAGRDNTVVIEDTGIGIEGEDLPRIFEKGYTGYNGRRDKKSTGIGLYLCKTIVDKLNHGIDIESVPGEGTKVYLDLKAATLQLD